MLISVPCICMAVCPQSIQFVTMKVSDISELSAIFCV